ncbi:MAG: hypothetical protein AMXMBFR58_30710 [Phycisphaerae bacterium]|nr:hypothetical protein [Phycisphaerales bacterium]MCK6478395.1 hypothetical protein [Phycisphaerales bacterium]
MGAHPATTPARTAPRIVVALLWSTAVVLTLLIAMQASSLLIAQPIDVANASHSGMVTASDDLVALSSEVGNEDLLVVLNNRTETLVVYKLDQNNQPQLLQQLSLPRIFNEARARGPGRR